MSLPADIPNPFRESVVADPWSADGVDVPRIHASVFDECCRAVDELRSSGRSAGILIQGQAGSGKTHLLRRLRMEFTSQDTPPTDPPRPRQIFSSIRLQTSPGMIWRHVRRRLTEDLLRASDGRICQLDQLLRFRMAEKRPAIGHLDLWWQYLWDEHPDAVDELLDHLAEHDGFDYPATTVLRHFLGGTHRRETLGWLRGEQLPDSALEKLGLKPSDEETAEPEAEARAAIRAFCALAGPQVPVVLCFDQVESLQADPEDKAGLFAFGQLVAALHDETENVLIVSCMQSSFLDDIRKHVRGADYDRIGSRATLGLDLLRFPQSVELVQSRLDAVEPLAALRAGHGALWPLSESDVRTIVGDQGCTPRELLKSCAEKFTIAQRGAAVDAPPVEEFLRDEWDGRLDQAIAKNDANNTEPILARGLPFLISVAAPDWKQQERDPRLPDVDLLFADKATNARAGVSLCTQGSMTSLAARLKRLRKQHAEAELRKLILVRDPRSPIGAGAKKANQYLSELRTNGAAFHQPSPELLAALDALASLLSEAQSGDLSAAGETVTPRTVREWLAAHLEPELSEFAELVTGAAASDDASDHAAADEDAAAADRLTEFLQERRMATIDEAAEHLGCDALALETAARRRPRQFALLTGPPTVVFERVESASPP
ncbi:MAG: hypothetical protein WD066_14620 [Planctomycetaceae bacterium]